MRYFLIIAIWGTIFLTSCHSPTEPTIETFTTSIPFEVTGDYTYTLAIIDRDGGNLRTLFTWHDQSGGDPDWSPKGTVVFSGQEEEGEFCLWTIKDDGTEMEKLFGSKDYLVAWPTFLPDGEEIIFVMDNNLWIIEGKGQPSQLTFFEEKNLLIHKMVVSNKGDKVAFIRYDISPPRIGNIWILDLIEGKVERLAFGSKVFQTTLLPAWSGDDTTLIFVHEEDLINETLYSFNLSEGKLKELYYKKRSGFNGAVFFLNRDHLLMQEGPNLLKFDLKKREFFQKITDFEGFTMGVSVSPDGKRIALLKDGQLWIMDSDGGDLRKIEEFPPGYDGCINFSWSKDSQKLACVIVKAEHVRIITGEEKDTIPTKRNEAWLGIEVIDINPELVEGVKSGAEIVRVQLGSPAFQSGLLPNDIITGIDKEEIESVAELLEELSTRKPGDEIEIVIIRGEKKINTKAVLAKWPELE